MISYTTSNNIQLEIEVLHKQEKQNVESSITVCTKRIADN